jgi:hypothetical protein
MRLRNDAPVFAWVFMAIWWVGLLAFTWVFFRDSPPPGQPAIYGHLLLAFFWISGAGCAAWAFRQRRVRLEVAPDGTVRIAETGPLGRRRQTLSRADVQFLRIEETKDGDGDPYYECWLLAGGRQVKVAEGHRRAAVEAKAAELREALRLR